MKKNYKIKLYAFAFMSMIAHFSSNAQFVPNQPVLQLPGIPLWTINAQVRPRGEFRHGLGNPVKALDEPSAFVSQRTNLNLGFRWDKMTFNMDIRDVRVWGQDAASINNADGNKTFLHQAWGEFILATTADTNCKLKIDNLSLKLGRQEIAYDDARLLGNLDWLQQGRRHDAAILKFLHKGYQIDAGFAFNQNTDAFNPGKTGVQYNPSNGVGPGPSTNGMTQQYKMMQYIYAARRFDQTRVSLLFFKDDFQAFDLINSTTPGATTGNVYRPHNDVVSRFTFGGQASTQIGNASEGVRIQLNGGAYGQFGTNPTVQSKTITNGRDVTTDITKSLQNINAFHAFIYGTAKVGKWSIGPGYEMLSGNDAAVTVAANGSISTTAAGSQNNRFDPLYGTPHRWWGFMDYFYVGTGSPVGGLQDLYLRTRYDAKNLFITLDIHQFMTQGMMDIKYRNLQKTPTDLSFRSLGSDLGQEIDLVVNYQANTFTNIEAGYSCYFSTDALMASKGFRIDDRNPVNQWTYVQVNFRPDFLYQKPVAIKN